MPISKPARRSGHNTVAIWVTLLIIMAGTLAGCSGAILRSAIRSSTPATSSALQNDALQSGTQTFASARQAKTLYAETIITLPTYPIERYQTDAIDPHYRWPYKRFDRDRFLAEAPAPEPRLYRVIILENEYLRLLILPELGGRLWQVIHKPTGNTMFYQNTVVKPSPWGPIQQGGWLGLGGLEWNIPVNEHGYDWGTPWLIQPLQKADGTAAVVVSTPRDGRLLHVEIEISLRPGVATVEIAPRVTNLSEQILRFDYWQTAMLAPGKGNQPSADLRFVLPSNHVALHSSGNRTLPGPQQRFTWPIYQGIDMSRLGEWKEYLGFFEYPSAHGPFAGVYDRTYDAGAVHLFPADVVRGSKVFALGWGNALESKHFTDDESTYVELHSGLSASFFEQTELPPGAEIAWREAWYPIHGIEDFVWAENEAAISVQLTETALPIGVYTTHPVNGYLLILLDGKVVARQPFTSAPDAPYTGQIDWCPPSSGKIEIQIINTDKQPNQILATYLIREA